MQRYIFIRKDRNINIFEPMYLLILLAAKSVDALRGVFYFSIFLFPLFQGPIFQSCYHKMLFIWHHCIHFSKDSRDKNIISTPYSQHICYFSFKNCVYLWDRVILQNISIFQDYFEYFNLFKILTAYYAVKWEFLLIVHIYQTVSLNVFYFNIIFL